MGATSARFTSSIFRAMYALEDRLNAVTFPPNTLTGETPTVTIGDLNPESANEAVIIVVGDATGGAALEWSAMSKPLREERFTLRVVVRVATPGTSTAREVLERLERIANAVQESVFDTNTTNNPHVVLGYDGEIPIGGIVSVVPDVFPDPNFNGWVGECVVDIACASKL